jgi:hypothetical protein
MVMEANSVAVIDIGHQAVVETLNVGGQPTGPARKSRLNARLSRYGQGTCHPGVKGAVIDECPRRV